MKTVKSTAQITNNRNKCVQALPLSNNNLQGGKQTLEAFKGSGYLAEKSQCKANQV